MEKTISIEHGRRELYARRRVGNLHTILHKNLKRRNVVARASAHDIYIHVYMSLNVLCSGASVVQNDDLGMLRSEIRDPVARNLYNAMRRQIVRLLP